MRLGALQDGGLAPAIMAIVDRGLRRNPRLSHALTAEIELCFKEGYPPVRIVFGERMVLIEELARAGKNLKALTQAAKINTATTFSRGGGVTMFRRCRG